MDDLVPTRRALQVDADGVEECSVLHAEAERTQTRCEHLRVQMDATSDVPEPLRSVIDRVHRGDYRQKNLSRTDVRSRLVATNVLLTRLERKAVRRCPVHILRDAHQPAR